ncbi:MAG: hypothetical protein PHW34_08515 [Hespellia sp.]|nr:hypothetical protein [Hespellia sp.]
MKKTIGFAISGIFLIVIAGLAGYYIGHQNKNKDTTNVVANNKAESQVIAVVNLDEGTSATGAEPVYYGEKVIQFPNDSFLYTSLEDARQGIENDTYAAYIIIPATFSTSVDSLNGTPTPATLQYALNENLDGGVQTEVLYQVLTFGEELDTDLSYMYLANVLQEFHGAQDNSTLVMSNDLQDKDAIDKIQASDLIQMVSIPELKREENNTTPVDIASYMETNGSLVGQVDADYQENVEDTRSQIASIGKSGVALTEALGALSGNVGEINLTTDADGNNLYEGGLTSLTQALQDYNNGINSQKADSTSQIKGLEAERKKIAGELAKSIETYNDELKTETATHIDQYGEELKKSIPTLSITEVADSNGTAYQISCSQVPEKAAPPIVTLKIVSEQSDENIQKMECLRTILQCITEAAVNGETEDVEFTVTETAADKSLQTVLAECDANNELMAKMNSCGYTSASGLLSDYSNGKLSFDTVSSHIEVEGNIADIDAYIQSAFDTVESAAYMSTPYTGTVIDQQGKPETDEAGNAVTIGTRLEDYKAFIDSIQNGVTTIQTVDAQNVTGIVTNGCIFPLVNRTEDVKSTIQQRYADETTEIEGYQKILEGYNPIIDTSKMQEYVAQMKTNGSELQKSVTENNQSYVEFANKVYTTTQENIMTLQTHIQEAKQTSENAVTKGLADAKSVKATTSGENQQAMADFAAKLPFTRLGTMEFTQSYQFIASPLQLTAVSDYQRLKDEVSITANATTSVGKQTAQTKQSSKYVQWILYVLLALLILGSVIGYVIRTKGLHARRPTYMSN